MLVAHSDADWAAVQGDRRSTIGYLFSFIQSGLLVHGKQKSIDIKHHFLQSALSDEKITVEYCPTADMVADFLTKPVATFKIKVCELHVWNVNY